MNTKEKTKKQIDRLSEVELEKVQLYLGSVKKSGKTKTPIRSLNLKGKLDKKDIRSLGYEQAARENYVEPLFKAYLP